jgi:hypothetical protein
MSRKLKNPDRVKVRPITDEEIRQLRNIPRPPKAPRLGHRQRTIIEAMQPQGCYLRRKMHDGYVRTWLERESHPRELGSGPPPQFENALVDSLVARGFLVRVPDCVHDVPRGDNAKYGQEDWTTGSAQHDDALAKLRAMYARQDALEGKWVLTEKGRAYPDPEASDA